MKPSSNGSTPDLESIAAGEGWRINRPATPPKIRRSVRRPLEVQIIFDGGSLGNPGQGYGSYALTGDVQWEPVQIEYPGVLTNNQAEYLTLIASLQGLRSILTASNRSLDSVNLEIRSDSKLLVEQMNGRWKVKNPGIRILHRIASELTRAFGKSSIAWHSRSESVRVLGH